MTPSRQATPDELPSLLKTTAIIVAAACALGIATMVFDWGAASDHLTAPLLIFILGALMVVAFVRGFRGDLLTPLNVAIGQVSLTYILGSVSQLTATGLVVDRFVIRALIVVLLGFAGFWAGYALPMPQSWITGLPAFGGSISPRRLVGAVFAIIVFSTVMLAIYLRLAGGGSYFAQNLYGDRMETTRGLYALTTGVSFVLALPVLWYGLFQLWTQQSAATFIIGLAFLGLAAEILVFPLGTRTFLLYPLFSIALARNYLKAPIKLPAALAGSAGLAFGAVGYQLYRYYTLGLFALGDLIANLTTGPAVFGYFASEFHVLGDLALAMQMWPGQQGFMHGKSFAMVLVTPIPRVIWPGKPSWSVGDYMNVEIYGAAEASRWGGRGIGAVGDGYANFGLVGALLVPMALGIISRYVYIYMARNRLRPFVVALYAAFLYCLFIALRGEVSGAVISFVEFWLPVWLVYVLARRSGPTVVRERI